jgi:hypothetical protein
MDVVLLQHTGIPMGSPGSPPFAQCICMYYEHHFYMSIRDHTRFSSSLPMPHLQGYMDKLSAFMQSNPSISLFLDSSNLTPDQIVDGARYVDDLFSLSVTYPSVPLFDRFVNLLLDALNHCYHPNMIVEMEDATTSFPYLESQLTVTQDSVLVRHRDKNIVSLRASGRLTLLNLQDFKSYHPAKIKLGLIISTLCRIFTYSSTAAYIVDASLDFFFVLSSLGYPRRMFITACHRVVSIHPHPSWDLITRLLSPYKHHRSSS